MDGCSLRCEKLETFQIWSKAFLHEIVYDLYEKALGLGPERFQRNQIRPHAVHR